MNLPFTLMVPTEVEAGYLRGLTPMIVCGVGEARAAAAVRRFADEASAAKSSSAKTLVLAGFGGGLRDEHAVATVVVPRRLTAADRDAIELRHPAATEHVAVTVDAVEATAEGKRALGVARGADVADMEGHAFADACRAAGLAWLVVRAVSDGVDDTLPEPIGEWVTPEGKTKMSAALKWAGIRPGRLAELTRLKARADQAGAALRAAVVRLAETWPPAASPD